MILEHRKLVGYIFRLSTSFHRSFLLDFDPETCEVSLVKNYDIRYRNLTIKCYLHMLVAYVVLGQTMIFSEKFKGDSKVLAWLTIVILFLINTQLNTCRKKAKSIKEYVNALVQFQKKYEYVREKELSLVEKLNLLFVKYAIFVELSFPPIFVYGLHWFKLCQPSMVGFWMLSQCQETGFASSGNDGGFLLTSWITLEKVVVLVFYHWVFAFGLNMTVFVNMIVHIMSTLSIREYIDLFGEWTRNDKIMPYQKGLMYRHIQLLNMLCNWVQQKTLMALNISAPIIVFGFCLAMLVRAISKGNSSISMLFIFLIGLFSTLPVIMQLLGGMHLACLESKHILQEQKWMHCRLYERGRSVFERKWERRFYLSCPFVKMKFGSNNFVEEQTPLRSLDAALNVTMQVLLVDE